MTSVRQVVQDLKNILKSLDDYSQNEEYILIEKSLNITKEQLFLKQNFATKELRKINRKLKRRLNGEPINKIFKEQNFFGFEFYINNNVLAPRKETEELVERVIIDIKQSKEHIKLLDICTGSGCIGLTLKLICKNKIDVEISDIDNKALFVAKINAEKFKLETQVKIKKSNMFERLKSNEKFDIITCNPPYISSLEYENLSGGVKNYDPKLALFGGEDGLNFYRILAREGSDYLLKNGRMYIEIGHKQKREVEKIFKAYNYEFECYKDYSKKDRIVKVWKKDNI